MARKDEALQKIESHEKLCRIMQKQTHDKIHSCNNKYENQNIFFHLHPKHKCPHLFLEQLVKDDNCGLHIYLLNRLIDLMSFSPS